MNTSTIIGNITIKPEIDFDLSWQSGTELVLEFVKDLAYDQTYEITLGTGITDPSGNPLTLYKFTFTTESEVITPVDTDNDNLPDSWEDTFGLNKSDPNDAKNDSDGDGLSNLEEYNEGVDSTDPTKFDTDDDGIDDDFERINKRDLEIQYSADRVEVRSILRSGETRDEIEVDIRYDDEGIEMEVSYESEYSPSSPEEFEIEFSVRLENITEFVDLDGNSFFNPDEDQIKALEETKAAALSAEQALAQKKQESSDLAAKLEAKKAELEKVKKEKELVLQRLEQKKSEM